VSVEVWALILSGASLLVGSGAFYFAWRASRSGDRTAELSEEQLQLAKGQAEMRPHLDVLCEVRRRRRDPASGTLRVEVVNSGRTAAHNVHGWIHFHESFFGPPRPPPASELRPLESVTWRRSWGAIFDDAAEPDENGWYVAQIYENEQIVVRSRRTFSILVTLRRAGKTPVRCRVVSDEGATFEDTLAVEVPGEGQA
jgi:hypothetical protein